MADTPEWLADRLQTEGEKTVSFFRGLPSAQHAIQIYTGGMGWQISQILAHFVATEGAFNLLLKDVLAGGEGSPEDFNLNEYNETWVRRLEGLSWEELLQRFSDQRRQNIELVSSMSLADLEKRGRHPFLGNTVMVDMVKLLYRHNQIHIRDVRGALAVGEEPGQRS